MHASEKGSRVRNFFEIEAKTLLDRYRIIETLLPNSRSQGATHAGEEGRYLESLLRAFLNKHLPANLKAVTGFILCPSTKTGTQDLRRVTDHPDRHSSQLDIIIYDIDAYPVFERFEEFCIVPPEGVVGILSVKKKIYNKDIEDEIAALKASAELCKEPGRRGPHTGIFAFSAQETRDEKLNARIFAAISGVHRDGAFDPMINEVSVLARTCVFKTRSEHGPPNQARYVGVDCVSEGHIPLQRLLQSLMSVYYDPSRSRLKTRPGFVSFRKETFRASPELGLVPFANP